MSVLRAHFVGLDWIAKTTAATAAAAAASTDRQEEGLAISAIGT
jgi:hypothetical protein